MTSVILSVIVQAVHSSYTADARRLQTVVYDAPSLPPGMEPWERFTKGWDRDAPWYRFPNLFANEAMSDAFGRPKRHTQLEYFTRKNGVVAYWWVPEGTNNLTMGPWFPQGSSFTKMVKYEGSRPPSPGNSLELEEAFECAFYDSKKKFMCYERTPHENQPDTVLASDPFGIFQPLTFTERFSERCTLRWLNNVFLNRHEPSGSNVKDYPEYTLARGVTCRDVGYWFGPIPDAVFANMRVWLMLDLTDPIGWLETTWNLMYTQGFYTPDLQLAPLGLSPFQTMGLQPIWPIGSWLNTQRYTFFWKSINQAWTR